MAVNLPKRKPANRLDCGLLIGGDEETRTPDPLHAKNENGGAWPEILVLLGFCPKMSRTKLLDCGAVTTLAPGTAAILLP